MTKKQPKKQEVPAFQAYTTHNRNTCIQVERADGAVKFIPLSVEGLDVHVLSEEGFDQKYSPMVDYPVDKAAKLYVEYSQNLGASKEALDFLGQIINISKQEYDMATAKKAATAAVKTAKAAQKKEPAGKKPVAKAAVAKKEAPAKKAPGEKKESASAMFCELIMVGKLTDDQIFAKVQEKFGLDDNKKSYVKWYRNKLTKDGKNPPAPK